jgi:hypothetical protein
MNKAQRIKELKSILADIKSHIVETHGYYTHTVDFDGEWGICTIEDADVNGDEITRYQASDCMYTETFDTEEQAIEWLVDSIHQSLNCELYELECEVDLLDGIEAKGVTITSINPQDSGWYVATDELDASDDIYAQTAAVNAKTVSVKTAFEVYEIPAEVLLEAVREMEVQEELAQVMTPAEIEREFGLADGTVRQAIFQGYFTRYRKADERTILIRRADAEVKWKK